MDEEDDEPVDERADRVGGNFLAEKYSGSLEDGCRRQQRLRLCVSARLRLSSSAWTVPPRERSAARVIFFQEAGLELAEFELTASEWPRGLILRVGRGKARRPDCRRELGKADALICL